MLRDGSGQNLREYLIATAARLIDQRGSAGLAVRDIAREAQVADGVLYNYFEDKEDLLVHALLAHVGNVMNSAPGLLPPPGEGTVAENLRIFIDGGLAVLIRVTPAFAGLLAQPKVLRRFHDMVGGDASFGAATEPGTSAPAPPGDSGQYVSASPADAAPSDPGRAKAGSPGAGREDAGGGAPGGAGQAEGLPQMLRNYLRGEQELGRVDPAADVDAAAALIVGAIHGQILPRVLFSPPGQPISTEPGLAARLTETVLAGIAPKPAR